MIGLDSRKAALRLLDAVLRKGLPLEAALDTAARDLTRADDRAFAHAIAAEALRRLPDLDALIDGATKVGDGRRNRHRVADAIDEDPRPAGAPRLGADEEPQLPAPAREAIGGCEQRRKPFQAMIGAADLALRYDGELVLVQVMPDGAGPDGLEQKEQDLRGFVAELAGARGRAVLITDSDPAAAIVRAADEEEADVLVVGNVGMGGRKEFLLGNVPNRVSHAARCTVVIMNTRPAERAAEPARVVATLRPPKIAPSTEVPIEMAVSSLRWLYCDSSRSTRSDARRRRSSSDLSFAACFWRSFATSPSRNSRRPCATRARKSPSLSPGFEVSFRDFAVSSSTAPSWYSFAASALPQSP